MPGATDRANFGFNALVTGKSRNRMESEVTAPLLLDGGYNKLLFSQTRSHRVSAVD